MEGDERPPSLVGHTPSHVALAVGRTVALGQVAGVNQSAEPMKIIVPCAMYTTYCQLWGQDPGRIQQSQPVSVFSVPVACTCTCACTMYLLPQPQHTSKLGGGMTGSAMPYPSLVQCAGN